MGTRQPDFLGPHKRPSVGFYLRVLAIGVYFGVVLVKSEVVRWQRINSMFRFEEAHMYLVILSAVVVGVLGMQLIKRLHLHTIDGAPIGYQPKPFHRGVILGGLAFGMGWAITGACPGPIYAQIGGGEWLGIVTFIGALAGMYLYALLRPKLPH